MAMINHRQIMHIYKAGNRYLYNPRYFQLSLLHNLRAYEGKTEGEHPLASMTNCTSGGNDNHDPEIKTNFYIPGVVTRQRRLSGYPTYRLVLRNVNMYNNLQSESCI